MPITLSNGTLSVEIDEKSSDTVNFDGQEHLFDEFYAFGSGSETPVVSTAGTVVSPFAPNGPNHEATIELTLPVSGGSTTLSVVRRARVDPVDDLLYVGYDVTNTGALPAPDLHIAQFADFDVDSSASGDRLFYRTSPVEHLIQDDTTQTTNVGLASAVPFSEHELGGPFSDPNTKTQNGAAFDNETEFPVGASTGSTADCAFAVRWELGDLPVNGTASLDTAFALAASEPRTAGLLERAFSPTTDTGELGSRMIISLWYDTNCNNVHDEGETLIFGPGVEVGGTVLTDETGAHPATLDRLAAYVDANDGFLPLDGVPDTSERDPLAGETPMCLGFAWYLPFETGNEIQSDSVAFDLGFYTQQARNNDGSLRI